MMQDRVAPAAQAPAPTWHRTAAIFVVTVAVVALVGHSVGQVRCGSRSTAVPPCSVILRRSQCVCAYKADSIPTQQKSTRMDSLLQTGAKTPYEHALEAQLAQSEKAAKLTALDRLGKVFFDDMNAATDAYHSSLGDCGVPGGVTDIRRAGCVIPVDGSTADLKCCTSCCQVYLFEASYPGSVTRALLSEMCCL